MTALRCERTTVESQTVALGLPRADASAFAAFSAEVRAAMGEANPAERRRVFELVKLRGVVRAGDTVLASIKPCRLVDIEWSGILWRDVAFSVNCDAGSKKLDTAFASLSRA